MMHKITPIFFQFQTALAGNSDVRHWTNRHNPEACPTTRNLRLEVVILTGEVKALLDAGEQILL
jgi:hypothetical protein